MSALNTSSHNVLCPPQEQCQASCELTCFRNDLSEYVALCCDCSNWCGVSQFQKATALAILLACLLLLAKKKWMLLPTGRAMGTFLCAVLMIACGNLHSRSSVLETPGLIDLSTLATLFGLMIAVGYLEDFGFMQRCMTVLRRGGGGLRLLMLKVTILTGLLSAFASNDAAVIALTGPLVVELRNMGVQHIEPFLVCLATSSNIGSALTLIGNPQNILIASFSKLSFFEFLVQSLPPVFGGLILNYLFLLAFYHKQLGPLFSAAGGESVMAEALAAEQVRSFEILPPFSEHHTGGTFLFPGIAERFPRLGITRKIAQSVAAIVTIIGLLSGFVFADSVALIALAGAVALLLIEGFLRDGDGKRVLKHVDGEVLVMISSLCVVISGARLTGVPDALYKGMNHVLNGVDMDYGTFADVMLACAFITFLSNIVSNVPTVLLLAPVMQASSNTLGWLCLAWVSTVAGNLTLVGSIANLLVAQKSEEKGVELTFWAHFKFAFWSTLIIIVFGCAILFYVVQPV